MDSTIPKFSGRTAGRTPGRIMTPTQTASRCLHLAMPQSRIYSAHKARVSAPSAFVGAETAATASASTQTPIVSPDSPLYWDAVYIGHMPLVGMEVLAALLPGQLCAPLQLHTFVAVGSSAQPEQCLLLDFLPERPTDPTTALALASGGSVQGQLRVRHLRSWIRGGSIRTRRVAQLGRPLGDDDARCAIEDFNRRWDPQLRLLSNDCRHYSAALLSYLTAQSYGIDDL